MDKQSFNKYSWLITKNNLFIITKEDYKNLYKFLLKPELKFSLSITSSNTSNLLQLAYVNNLKEILGNTSLKFTFNNTLFDYNIYELEQGLKYTVDGLLPGVRTLINFLGEYPEIPKEEKEKREKAGRPPKEELVSPRRKIVGR